MSKVKRILSVIMAMVMVLAMSVPTFAATANINLSGFESAAKVEYLQIIEPNQTTTSGWAFANGADQCFADALGLSNTPENQQKIIWGLIKYQQSSIKLPTGVEATTITAANIDTALSKVKTLSGYVVATSKTAISVNKAGVYAIKAEEANYTYKTMSAYVSFTPVTNGKYENLDNTDVTAKKATTTVTKTTTDENHVVAIGDIVTYQIEVYVPYIDASNTNNRTFSITDEITGADYYLTGEGAISSVVMDGSNSDVGTIVKDPDNDHKFSINLDSLVNDLDNPNAGKRITVTYTAKVTAVEVGNNAGSHVSGSDYNGTPVKLFTGEITLLKYGENNENIVLSGAEFEVYKDGAATPLKFKLDNGKYKYAPDAADASATVVTGDNGKVIVEGLDIGSYHFKETKAPKGYSINTDGKTIPLSQTGVAIEIIKNSDKLNDTKLSALPATGGIGTTIFTIGGCAIMIVAAGLFFATRRKTQK